jgi:cellulose synthase/poly-beta-1,6-N-acetylglucosamine synthase-like glycosyltransferase
MTSGDERLSPPAHVSVIIPVKNEEASIERLLRALDTQTHRPAEIVITDGGSTDRTKQMVRAFQAECSVPIVLIESEQSLPGRGRNLAIARAASEWVACVDGGIVPAPDWLAELVAVARREPVAQVIYGRVVPVTDTWFTACAAIVYVPPGRSRFAASCLLRRAAWVAAGGFREDLRSGEDLLFFRSLERAGVREAYSDHAVVAWELQPETRRTFRRFATYSCSSMIAGLGREWQLKVIRLYVVLAALLLMGLWVWPVALLPPALLLLRAERRVWLWHRAKASRRVWRELLSPRRVLTVAWIHMVIDLATFWGLWRWATGGARRDSMDRTRSSAQAR